MRFKLKELTPKRVAIGVARRIATVPDKIAWRRSDWGRRNQERLAALRGRHRGERCFLMANGPGLVKLDLAPLAQETTFSLNRAYTAFDTFGFLPTYFSVLNDLLLEQFRDDINGLPMPKFLSWRRRALFSDRDDIYFLRTLFSLEDHFQTDVREGVCSGATVTFTTLQLAYHMGFSEVVIVGLDHNYAQQGTPNEVVKDQDRSHFSPNYFPRGTRWELPDLHRTTLAYSKARKAYEADGRRILDASVDGKCTVFEKVAFEDVL
jgi:hypothetical protein